MAPYLTEEFSESEARALAPYFSNVVGPVYALLNLPETVKAALFARSARSSLGMRRLFLKEFVGELDLTPGGPTNEPDKTALAGLESFDRVFFEYGNDSVAQLGGVHLVCEQVSAPLAKVIERSRVMSYVEPSGGSDYELRHGGRYQYFRSPTLLSSTVGTNYVSGMDRLFAAYQDLVPAMAEYFRSELPRHGCSDFEFHQMVRAEATAAVRGVLPVGSLVNVGVFGSAQGYEAMLLRLRAHRSPEARAYAEMMLVELRKVIPSFLRRVDDTERGLPWSGYLADNQEALRTAAASVLPDIDLDSHRSGDVELTDFDPDAEVKLVASMLYAVSSLSERALLDRARSMTVDERLAVMRAYVGNRQNRRHRPGRALERPHYHFDIVADYTTFSELQRHRMLSIEWQKLTPGLGYDMPDSVFRAELDEVYDDAVAHSAELFDVIHEVEPSEAHYALCQAHRMRFNIDISARSAMHLIELRTSDDRQLLGRRVAQQMHRQIVERAGHQAIAAMMRFANHGARIAPTTVLATEGRSGHPVSHDPVG